MQVTSIEFELPESLITNVDSLVLADRDNDGPSKALARGYTGNY